MFSAGDDLILAIVAAAQDSFGQDVDVTDGFRLPEDFTTTLMIGVDDPDGVGSAIEGERDFATTGLDGSAQEQASILCAAVAYDGNYDYANARRAVYDVASVVEQLCRINGQVDPAFGVPQVLWTVAGRSFSLDQPRSDFGAVAILKFRIYYEARV